MYKPKENKYIICETVGALKTALSRFNDETLLGCGGFGDYISVSLWYNEEPPHKTDQIILIEEIEESDAEEKEVEWL